MKVTVVCYGALRDHLPPEADGRRAEVEISTEATVADVVRQLGAPSGLVFAVLVDGDQGSLDSRVIDGAEVTLMPPFAGGSISGPD